jgi:ABC-type uncharacterized transport system auxiliary subunit
MKDIFDQAREIYEIHKPSFDRAVEECKAHPERPSSIVSIEAERLSVFMISIVHAWISNKLRDGQHEGAGYSLTHAAAALISNYSDMVPMPGQSKMQSSAQWLAAISDMLGQRCAHVQEDIGVISVARVGKDGKVSAAEYDFRQELKASRK